jgi:putative membrane protein
MKRNLRSSGKGYAGNFFFCRPNFERLGLVHWAVFTPSHGVSTMKTFVAAVAALAICMSPALAQSVGEKSGINSALGITPKTEDFVKEVAVSDMFEIESSKLATTKGDAATKTFAAKMVTDHTKTSSELKTAVAGNSALQIPTALDSSHQS